MARTEKQFDAVQMMRSIRDRISEEIKGMTFEEEQAYIREGLRGATPDCGRIMQQPADRQAGEDRVGSTGGRGYSVNS